MDTRVVMPSPQVVEQGPQAVLHSGQGTPGDEGATKPENWGPWARRGCTPGPAPWSHTHSGQQRPGTSTLLGRGQSRLGSRTSSGHSGTQVKPPSSQRQRSRQWGWKVSPSRYTRPFTSQRPSSSPQRHTAPRPPGTGWQTRPWLESQTWRWSQGSPSRRAHTWQQLQPSSTRGTPSGHRGGGQGQAHGVGHSWAHTFEKRQRREKASRWVCSVPLMSLFPPRSQL